MAFPETPLEISSELQLGSSYLSSGAVASGIDAPTGGLVYMESSNEVHIGSDIDLRIDCAADDWTPPRNIVFLAKNYSYGVLDAQLSYELELLVDGTVRFIWSADGTFGGLKEAVSTVGVGLSDGTRKTIRIVMDADNGATVPEHTVTFYLGDGINGPWTQLGAVFVGAGATEIAETTTPIEIGTSNLGRPGFGTFGNFQGKIYSVEIWDKFFGERIANPDFTRIPRGTEEFLDGESNNWLVLGSSFIRQEWINATPDTRYADNIVISRALSGEASSVDPASCAFTLDNREGHYSSRNPTGPYYGKLRRNTPHRVSVPADESALVLNRASHDYAFALDSSGMSVTGDLDLRVDVELTSWQGLNTLLIAKVLGTADNSYYMVSDYEGYVWLSWSATGTSMISAKSTEPVPLPHHGRKTIRATLDINNGASGNTVMFYIADNLDGPWSQLGAPVVTAGTTSIFDSAAEVWFGGYSSAHPGAAHGRFYGARIYSGINGTLRASPDFGAQANDTRYFADAQGNIWRLAGSAEISGRDDRHFGAVAEWPQRWDLTGTDAYVPAVSSGTLRRIGQGESPLKSTLRRGIESLGAALISYWPLEDEEGASAFASAIADYPPMISNGTPTFATDSAFECSKPLPHLNEAMVLGFVPPYIDVSGEMQAWFVMHVPPGGVPSERCVFRIWTRDSQVVLWQLHVNAAGDLRFLGFDAGLSIVVDSGLSAFAVNGKLLRVSIGLQQNGTGVEWFLHTLEVGAVIGNFLTAIEPATTLGRITRIDSNHERILDDVAIGHISVHREIISLFDLSAELNAHRGERAAARIYRLCTEEKVPISIIGSFTDSVILGPQLPDTLINLLTESADADLGILHEPRDFLGLAYRTRASMYAQSSFGGTAVTFDYSLEQLTGISPIEDDRRTRNDITVTRRNGSSARSANDVGNITVPELSVPEIGRYDDTPTINLNVDEQLVDQASWRVHMGTVDEARYPTISVLLERAQLVSNPELTKRVKQLDVGDKLVITNTPDRFPPDDIEQIALGFSETLGGHTHSIDINCAPDSPYRVGVYDAASSRYDSQASSLVNIINETDFVLIVRTETGPQWQTVGDFPFDVVIGGERMTVISVTGQSSSFSGDLTTQEFIVTRSVNGVIKSHVPEEPIHVYQPVHYALGDDVLVGFIEPDLPDEPPPPDPGVTTVIRINAGGPQYTGPDGVVWAADQHFTGGTVANQGAPSYGTQHDEMLKTERWGAFNYAIPFVPAGAATVKLYFSENFAGTPGNGYRQFDVTLNGVLVSDNLDVYDEANGTFAQLIKTYATTIPASGICTIAFSLAGSTNNAAVVMGIEILAEGVDPPPPPPPPDPDPIGTSYGWFSGAVRPEVAGQYTQPNVDYWNTSFRGVEVTSTLTYTVRNGGWDQIVQPGYVLGNWTNPRLVVVIAQPFTPTGIAGMGAQAAAINSGAYDGHWQQWGRSLNAYVARGMAEPITEIGWEFNGNWFPHSATNAVAWRTAFARIVTQTRITRPAAKFAWTMNAGYSQNPPSHNSTDCWPGDSYVDYIGLDIYDHYPRAIGYNAINNRENTVTGRAKYWEAFADLHNKQMIFPEWGLNGAVNKLADGGQDNPDFFTWMKEWFNHLKAIGLMYAEVYFNDTNQNNVWSNLLPVHDNRNPNSRARYLSLW